MPEPPEGEACLLEWNYDMPASFNVYHRAGDETYSVVHATTDKQAACSAMGIQADGQAHYFQVTAVVAGRESAPSNEASKVLR